MQEGLYETGSILKTHEY